MKVLIIGSKGMLGQELAKSFAKFDLTLWDKEEIDITNAEQVKKMIKDLSPDLVINAAAYNAVDDIEENYEVAKKVNVDGPINLAKTAGEEGAVFVHYSTDYVFDGQKKEGYFEHDLPSPISRYGESKFLGEEVLEHNPAGFVIRSSRLFGLPAKSEGAKKSFIELMLKLADEKDELEIVDEEVSNPTYVVDLAEATKDLTTGNYHPGIYHIANEGGCTWCEFAIEIFSQTKKTVKVKPVPSSRFPRPAKRPAYSSLQNTKFPRMRHWKKALKDFLRELEQENSVSVDVSTEKQVVKVEIDNLPVVEPVVDEKSVEPTVKTETPIIKKDTVVVPEISLSDLKSKVEQVEIKVNSQIQKAEIPEQKMKDKGEERPQVNINSKQPEKNMKGIILSGGKGTRLYPLTKITSKQLLPVFDKPMILYPLETLVRAGVKEILIIVAPEYAGQYLQLLGSGKEWGVKIRYEIQDEPKGLPEAFVIGENFIGEDNVTLILGDNLFFDHDFTEDIRSFEKGGRIFAVEVADPERFGVVEFNVDMNVVSIEEKPKEPKSNYAIPGIYIFDNRVSNIAKGIKPTWRPETDITEVHKAYLGMNELDVRKIRGRWYDAGTFESLLKASNIAATMEYQKKMGYNEGVK